LQTLNKETAMAHATPPHSDALRARLAPFKVLDDFHAELIAALEELQALGQALAERDPGPGMAARAKQAIAFFGDAAAAHHADEEEQVFPSLLASGDKDLVDQVRHLQQDHGWLNEDWRALSLQLGAVADGYNWYDAEWLVHAITVFTALYHDHIALEESLVYPEARAALAAAHTHHGRQLAARMREGAPWVAKDPRQATQVKGETPSTS
jgi:hemerythrin-like domain-containing protein